MKNKFLLFMVLFLGIIMLSSCEKTLAPSSGNEPGNTDFLISEKQLMLDYDQYSISGINWEIKDGYQVASFSAMAKATSSAITAWYKLSGENAERQMDVRSQGTIVPDIIKSAFDETPYADVTIWTIEDIELENRYNNTSEEQIYQIELENVANNELEAELFFDAKTGVLLFSKESIDTDDNDDDRYIVSAELAQAVKTVYANAVIVGASKDDDEIEVDVVVLDGTIKLEIEMSFSLDNVYERSEYDVEYGELPAKYKSVKDWINDVINGIPALDNSVDVEIIEGNDLTIDDIICSSYIEIVYETNVGGEDQEFTILFYLDANNNIIKVKNEGEDAVFEKYTNGTFILNQGNMSDGIGSLIFVDSNGLLTENVYKLVNNESLPNLAADMFISDDKVYIISQGGILIVANAHTLQKENEYSSSDLGIPSGHFTTHIAVVNDDVFIRHGGNGSNSYIRKFNLKDNSSSEIVGPGATYVSKYRMAVLNNKLYTSSGPYLLILDEDAKEFRSIEMPGLRQGLSIIASEDGYIWLSGKDVPLFEDPVGSAIMKMNVETEEIEVNPVEYELGLDVLSDHPIIGVIGNVVYFHSGQDIIYHNFDTKDTRVAFDNMGSLTDYSSGIVFNGVGIDSENNKLYINMLKGFNEYIINDILVFDIKSDKLGFNRTYKNKTRFPNGFHITSQFNN